MDETEGSLVSSQSSAHVERTVVHLGHEVCGEPAAKEPNQSDYFHLVDCYNDVSQSAEKVAVVFNSGTPVCVNFSFERNPKCQCGIRQLVTFGANQSHRGVGGGRA